MKIQRKQRGKEAREKASGTENIKKTKKEARSKEKDSRSKKNIARILLRKVERITKTETRKN